MLGLAIAQGLAAVPKYTSSYLFTIAQGLAAVRGWRGRSLWGRWASFSSGASFAAASRAVRLLRMPTDE